MANNVAGIPVRRVSAEYFGDDAVDLEIIEVTLGLNRIARNKGDPDGVIKAMFRCGGVEIGPRQHVRPPGRLTALRWREAQLNPCDGRKGR